LKIFILNFLVLFLLSCSHQPRPKGEARYYSGEITSVFADRSIPDKKGAIMFETISVDNKSQSYGWFYIKMQGAGQKLTIHPSISTQTDNPDVYLLTSPDSSMIGRLRVTDKVNNKHRIEIFNNKGFISKIDHRVDGTVMYMDQHVTKLDDSPVVTNKSVLHLVGKQEFDDILKTLKDE
jgi:hypothetical protein